jgi:hypothetical protein
MMVLEPLLLSDGFFDALRLCAFLQHGKVVTSRTELTRILHADRTWQGNKEVVSPAFLAAPDKIHPNGVLQLVVQGQFNRTAFVVSITKTQLDELTKILTHVKCPETAALLTEYYSKTRAEPVGMTQSASTLFRSNPKALEWVLVSAETGYGYLQADFPMIISKNLEAFDCSQKNEKRYVQNVLASATFQRRSALFLQRLRAKDPTVIVRLDAENLKGDLLAFALFARCCRGPVSDSIIVADALRDAFVGLGDFCPVLELLNDTLAACADSSALPSQEATASSSLTLLNPGTKRKTSLQMQYLPPPGKLLSTIIEELSATDDRLKGDVRLLQKRISLQLVEAVSSDRNESLTKCLQRLQVGAHGQKTWVPSEYEDLARGLLLQWAEDTYARASTLPTGGAERTAPTTEDSERSIKRQKPAFLATTAEHIAAKTAANALFVSGLKLHRVAERRPLFVLDAFADGQGFRLRSISALKAAGFNTLYLANPDEGICTAARASGAVTFCGTWEEAVVSWITTDPALRFGGLFLDLCGGSDQYVTRQVHLAASFCEAPAVLAVTLLERDYSQQLFPSRLFHLLDVLHQHGWRPALQTHLSSNLVYKTGAGQDAVTMVYALD